MRERGFHKLSQNVILEKNGKLKKKMENTSNRGIQCRKRTAAKAAAV